MHCGARLALHCLHHHIALPKSCLFLQESLHAQLLVPVAIRTVEGAKSLLEMVENLPTEVAIASAAALKG